MKKRFFAALLLAALAIPVLAGCATARQLDAAGEEVLSRMATAARPSLIGEEKAIEIALQDAGFTRDQVERLRTELDYDAGKGEYEVDFNQGGYEYDYEIDAESGKIISFDKDRLD